MAKSQAVAKMYSWAVSDDPPSKPMRMWIPTCGNWQEREVLPRPHMLVWKVPMLNLMYCTTTSRLVIGQQFLLIPDDCNGIAANARGDRWTWNFVRIPNALMRNSIIWKGQTISNYANHPTTRFWWLFIMGRPIKRHSFMYALSHVEL